MEIGSAATFASDNAMAKVQGQVGLAVQKKVLDIAEATAQQMLEMLPPTPPAPAVGSTVGGIINTTA